MEKSKTLANIIYNEFNGKVDTTTRALRFAGFAVLKNSNMASVLIELGFISNKSDLKKLKSASYKKFITKGLVKAINEYFQ